MYVVRRARHRHVVFLESLQQTIKQAFVGFNFLFQNVVVDRRLVLVKCFGALLIKCVAQSFLSI